MKQQLELVVDNRLVAPSRRPIVQRLAGCHKYLDHNSTMWMVIEGSTTRAAEAKAV